MPTNKNANVRYRVLDKCFRNTGRKYCIDDLVNECNRVLCEMSEFTEGVKKRQVYDDINFMCSEAGYSIPLEKVKEGRKTYYYYSDRNFSISSQPLNEGEANQLKEVLMTLSRFNGMPQFQWVDEIVTRLESSFDLIQSETKAIAFEQNQYLKGLEHISSLYHAITYKKVLAIEYQSFKQKDQQRFIIHPYFLKQYNNRWFLFGKNQDYDSLMNLSLDRIVSIDEGLDIHYEDSSIDMEEYFENVVGVTIPEGQQPEEIRLLFSEALLPYILTKPIHPSQKKPVNDDRIVRLYLIPNYELESLILSFGDQVEVLSPLSLRASIAEKATRIGEKYK